MRALRVLLGVTLCLTLGIYRCDVNCHASYSTSTSTGIPSCATSFSVSTVDSGAYYNYMVASILDQISRFSPGSIVKKEALIAH